MKIKHFLASLILFTVGCSGQEPTKQQVAIDTAKQSSADSGTVKIQTPTITTKTIDANDSSYFSITLLNSGFEATLLNKKEILEDSAAVDRFIRDNKTLINPQKIIVIGSYKESHAGFDAIIAILKKYDYLKFQMITRPPRQ